jgi:hypothetical protein
MSGAVEIGEVTGPHIDSPGAEARHPGIDAIKIHQAFQRVSERFGIVEAGRP